VTQVARGKGRVAPGRDAPTTLRVRASLAVSGACVAAVGLYAVLRGVQAILFKEPNPATVIWSAHAGYLWRVWTVCYGGVMAGFLVFAASKQNADRVGRALVVALYVASGLILAQGLLVP
jgi:hypothetical protein